MLQRVLKPNGVLAVGAFDDVGVETPLNLPREQQDHVVAAQQRFSQVPSWNNNLKEIQ